MIRATLIVYLDNEIDPPMELSRWTTSYTATHPRSRSVALDVGLDDVVGTTKRMIMDAGFEALEKGIVSPRDCPGLGLG